MEALLSTIDSAIQSKDWHTLATVFSEHGGAASWQSVGPGEQRSLAAHFLQRIVATPVHDELVPILTTALSHLPATVEQAADNVVRQRLFEYLVEQEEFVEAARILGATRMETNDPQSVYYMTAAACTDTYVKVAECCLAADEMTQADAAVTKAGALVQSMDPAQQQQHTALLLRYKSVYARVLDAHRKFLSAAQRYHELSCWTQQAASPSTTTSNDENAMDKDEDDEKKKDVVLLDEEDVLHLLGRAATCAILAPSGPQRQRVLQHLAADPRLSQLDALSEFKTHSQILTQMVRLQIIQPSQLVEFEASLQDHQKAVMGDGLTLLERGVVEHNLLAVSHLYRSIRLTELARILGVTTAKAERIAANMILEGSLQHQGASMDQVQGLLEFEPLDEAWDKSITSWCMELNRVTHAIESARR